jgi:lipopolysaccharide heptosyltransferase I
MRIVLVRLSALGDIVHTWPLADAIRASRPDAHVTWVVEAPFTPLVDGHPAVDLVIPTRSKAWRRSPFDVRTRHEVAVVKTRLRELEPDVALDPQGLVKSAFVTRWTRARRRVGLARPWRRELLAGLAYTECLPGSLDHPHVVATNLALAAAVGAPAPVGPVPPDGRWLVRRVADRPVPGGDTGPRAVLLPGVGQPHKILSTETLSEVARGLAADGLDVVVAFGPGEEARAQQVAEKAGDGARLAPPTDLLELVRLMDGAHVVVGGDTGPMHLAASLGVPTVGVYLASDWRRNGPLGPHTAVVAGSSTTEDGRRPTGRARSRPVRQVTTDDILAAVADVTSTALEEPARGGRESP